MIDINAEEKGYAVTKRDLEDLQSYYDSLRISDNADMHVVAIGIDTALRWLRLPPYDGRKWYE